MSPPPFIDHESLPHFDKVLERKITNQRMDLFRTECSSNTESLQLFMSQSVPTGYIPPGNPQGLAQKHCPGGRDLTFESCPGAWNSTRAGILWKLKVKHFVRVLVLSVTNTGCPKNC